MERTVLKELIEWKERADRKPLILNGARQVGKTWLLHEFARLEYKKEAYVVRTILPGSFLRRTLMWKEFCVVSVP